jgi:hypothetical protein
LNRCVTVCAVPRSTAEAPDEQCKYNQQCKRTRVGVVRMGKVRVVSFIPLLIRRRCGMIFRRLACVTHAVVTAAAFAPLVGVATEYAVTREGNLGVRSRSPESIVLAPRNQKREKQNADGRK